MLCKQEYIIIHNIPAINHDRNTDRPDGKEPRMKWWIWLIVGGVVTAIILLGAGTTAIISSINWFKPDHYNFDKVDATETVELQDVAITEIKIEADTCAVFIEPTAEDDITVGYVKKGFEKGAVTVDKDGGVVNIKAETEQTRVFGIKVNFGQRSADKFIIVKVPAALIDAPAYDIKVTTGDIKITGKDGENALSFGKLSIENVTGDVTLSDIAANDLTFKGTTGAFNLKDLTANSLSVTTTTGAVSLKKVVLSGEMKIEATTGDVDVESSSKKAAVKVTTGQIKFDLTADDITVKATTGNIGGTVKGVMTEYTITAKAKTGRCNLTDRVGTTDKTLDVSVTTGRVNVVFEE